MASDSQSVETADTRTSNLDAVMADITSLGYGTPEYHEAMWMLLSVMARRQACIADRLRADRRKRERAAETRRLRLGSTAHLTNPTESAEES